MEWDPIPKHLAELSTEPNLVDYDAAYAAFSWEEGRQAVAGLPGGGGVNIGFEALDRHVLAGRGDKLAVH